ncbi:MAG: putative DNA binding domain-containing protein [Bacteroidales bacterium]|nr:putative DNA binding domain-containing protein [Bacteroidales bacterium]
MTHRKEDILKTLIGETTNYDKKLALELKKPKSWCKSVSAFANGGGGKLIFGIADDGEIVGLADAKGDAEKISEMIKVRIDPIPDIELSFAEVEGKVLIVLTVMSGCQTPYYYIGDGLQQAFVRIGNESVVATPTKHKELVLKGSNMSYDSQVSRWRFDDMAFTILRATYFNRTNRSFVDSDFESFGIINEKGELTNAGALLADYSPVRHSRLFCTRWNGTDKAHGMLDAMDDEEYSGSLITLLQSGLAFVRRNNKTAWRKTADNRLEYPEYPERAVEEGLVNALIHRSYLELGSEVHIDMYDDRLEIYSPGGLVDGGSINDMDVLNMASRRRNPVLADIFSRLKYMERRGSGFKKIVAAYKEYDIQMDGLKPTFSTPRDNFVLTLPRFDISALKGVYADLCFGDKESLPEDILNIEGGLGEKLGEKCTEKLGEKQVLGLGENQKAILRFLSSDPGLNINNLSKALGISTTAIEKNIASLKGKGLLIRVGGDKGGRWKVVECRSDVAPECRSDDATKCRSDVPQNVPQDIWKKLTPRQQCILHLLIEQPSINREGISVEMKVSKKTIEREIDELRKCLNIRYEGLFSAGHWVVSELSDYKA